MKRQKLSSLNPSTLSPPFRDATTDAQEVRADWVDGMTDQQLAETAQAIATELIRRRVAGVHKAKPDGDSAICVHCHREIKRVPGGQGPTWVHADSGAVAGTVDLPVDAADFSSGIPGDPDEPF